MCSYGISRLEATLETFKSNLPICQMRKPTPRKKSDLPMQSWWQTWALNPKLRSPIYLLIIFLTEIS